MEHKCVSEGDQLSTRLAQSENYMTNYQIKIKFGGVEVRPAKEV